MPREKKFDCYIGIALPIEVKEKLQKIANQKMVSISAVVREAVAEYLRKNEEVKNAGRVL